MKITFLGTSHGLAEPGRKFSSVLLEEASNKYLIDCGCNAAEAFANLEINPAELKAVFITHTHSDHTYGLLPIINLMCWAPSYQLCNPEFFLPEKEAFDNFVDFCRVTHETPRENMKFRKTVEGEIFNDAVIRVSAIRTHHLEYSFGYVVEANSKRILFTGDIASPETETNLFRETYDLIVGECAHFDGKKYAKALEENPPKSFCFTHYSPLWLPTAKEFQEMTKDRFPVNFAVDGSVIEIK